MTDDLGAERSVRLLHAKAGELEHRVLMESETLDEPMTTLGLNMAFTGLMADIALVCSLLAEHIQRAELD